MSTQFLISQDFGGISRLRLVNASGIISTIATAASNGFNVGGIAEAPDGSIYLGCVNPQVVRKVSADFGTVTVVAGTGVAGYNGDGIPATTAQINFIGVNAVATDSTGNFYIADTDNFIIRKVTVATGIISTVAGIPGVSGTTGDGGPATSAKFSSAAAGGVDGTWVDAAGNIFICDRNQFVGSRIRKITAATGTITTVAGQITLGDGYGGDGGPATSAQMNAPLDTCTNLAGDLFIADTNNNVIRKVDHTTGVITTVAGNFNGGIAGFSGDGGLATSALLNNPEGVRADSSGNLFIVDSGNFRIRMVNLATGIISTVAGNGGAGFSGDGGLATAAAIGSFTNSMGIYTSGSTALTNALQCLVYDQNKNRWRAAAFPVQITTVYSEEAGPASSLLLGDEDGTLFNTGTGSDTWLSNVGGGMMSPPPPPPLLNTTPVSIVVQTGAFDQGSPLNLKEYGNVIFDLDPGGATTASPVKITPLLNGETITDAAILVTGTGRQQVPLPLGDMFGFNIEFRIEFSRSAVINPILYQFDILWKPEPVSLTHWEARESSYGLQGFGHIRDSYVAIRSNSNVTLTMTVDGVSQTYTIPSTGGWRNKVYLPFAANKGKLYKFAFDSADGVSQFRLYVEDCELRIKPWITSLGYQTIKAWGAESQLVTAAYESQLLGGGR